MSVQSPVHETDAEASKSAAKVEEVVGGGFDVRKFVENFEVLADAAGGPARLRELVIELAAKGLLLEGADLSSWKKASLDDAVVDFQNGVSKRHGDHGSPVPVLRLADIGAGVRLREDNLREIVLTAAEQEKYRVRRGDILVIRVNGSGELVGRFIPCETDRNWAYSDHLIRVRLRTDLLDPSFLCAVSRSASARGHFGIKTVTTAGQKTINQKGVGSLPLLLPPLPVQKRIVAKVDQLITLCDELDARQVRKRDTGNRLTKSALQALSTADGPEEFDVAWKRVVENFDVLVDRAGVVRELHAAVLGLGLKGWLTRNSQESPAPPSGWSRTTLGSLASFVSSGSRNWKHYYAETGAVFVRSQDISSDVLDLSSPAFVSVPTKVEGTRTRIEKDDILITITGANVGKAAHVDRRIPEAYVSQHVALVRLRDPALAHWLHWWLVCPSTGRGQLLGSSYGDKPGLNLSQVKCVSVDVPPAAERARILALIARQLSLCSDLEDRLRIAEDRAGKLAEAIVQALVA